MATKRSLLIEVAQAFPFLFETYSFQPVHFEPHGRPGQGGILGLESSSARLRYAKKAGSTDAAMYIGFAGAEFAQENTSSLEDTWFPLVSIVTFLESRIAPQQVREDAALSERFEVLASEIFDLFASREMLHIWQRDFNQYLNSAKRRSRF